MMKHTVQAVAVATAKVLKGNKIRNKPVVCRGRGWEREKEREWGEGERDGEGECVVYWKR